MIAPLEGIYAVKPLCMKQCAQLQYYPVMLEIYENRHKLIGMIAVHQKPTYGKLHFVRPHSGLDHYSLKLKAMQLAGGKVSQGEHAVSEHETFVLTCEQYVDTQRNYFFKNAVRIERGFDDWDALHALMESADEITLAYVEKVEGFFNYNRGAPHAYTALSHDIHQCTLKYANLLCSTAPEKFKALYMGVNQLLQDVARKGDEQ